MIDIIQEFNITKELDLDKLLQCFYESRKNNNRFRIYLNTKVDLLFFRNLIEQKINQYDDFDNKSYIYINVKYSFIAKIFYKSKIAQINNREYLIINVDYKKNKIMLNVVSKYNNNSNMSDIFFVEKMPDYNDIIDFTRYVINNNVKYTIMNRLTLDIFLQHRKDSKEIVYLYKKNKKFPNYEPYNQDHIYVVKQDLENNEILLECIDRNKLISDS